MYPREELTRLAAHKAVLIRKIGLERAQCEEAARGVLRPVELLDRMMILWRRLRPWLRLTALPLPLLIQRTLFPRSKIAGLLVRWLPPAVAWMRGGSPAFRRIGRPIKAAGAPAR